MHETERAVTEALWSCVGQLAPASAPPMGRILVDEVCGEGPQQGLEPGRRIRVGAPVPAAGGWVCHVDIAQRTSGPVAVAGRGPVDALINALRVVDLALGEWRGLPRQSPVTPAEPGDDWAPPLQEAVDDPVAEARWRVLHPDGARMHRLAIGPVLRGPALRGHLPRCASYVDIKGWTSGPRANVQYGAVNALRLAAYRAAAFLHTFAEVEDEDGGPLQPSYRAVTEAIWRGASSLDDALAPPMGAVAARDRVELGAVFGRDEAREIEVGDPVQGPNGRWFCHVAVAGRTSGPLAVAGRGPVDSLIGAMRLVDLALSDWCAPPPRQPHDADPPAPRDWRAPEAERIPDVLAADRWRIGHPDGARVHEVTIGRPHRNPNDPDGTWLCHVRVEGWVDAPRPVYGVGPVDTLRNAAKLVAGILHLHGQVERVG